MRISREDHKGEASGLPAGFLAENICKMQRKTKSPSACIRKMQKCVFVVYFQIWYDEIFSSDKTA